MKGYQEQSVKMEMCVCRRKVQVYQCRIKACPNNGEIYCQDCVNEFQRHVHPAKKYIYCRDEELEKWKNLNQEVDKIFKNCERTINKVSRLAKYLEDISEELMIANEH